MNALVAAYRRVDRRFMALAAPWVYVVVPGVALHELAHAAVGQRYGDVTIDWTRPAVEVDWNDRVPVWAVFAYFLAPLPVGGLVAFALAVVLPLAPPTVAIWLVLNWVLLAGPSIFDVVGLVSALASG